MDLYGYCPRCNSHTSDMHDNTLCDPCEESSKSGDEITRRVNKLLNAYALKRKDSTLIEALQVENQGLKRKINTSMGES